MRALLGVRREESRDEAEELGSQDGQRLVGAELGAGADEVEAADRVLAVVADVVEHDQRPV